MRQARRDYVAQVLEQARGKVEVAAMVAGVPRSYFYQLMDKAGIPRRRRPNKPRADR